jgi:dienelactone hydrolase
MNVWYKYNASLSNCSTVLMLCGMFFYQNVKAQTLQCQQQAGPYGFQVLSSQVMMQTQVYRETTTYDGKPIRLAADIYRIPSVLPPAQLRERPLLVLLHGGGIKMGSRQTGLQPFIAQYLAQRGYVTVCADYRLGWPRAYETALCGLGTEQDYLDAKYRAMQDERALIQYLKRQANTIGFDTNRIFLMGISSGATIAMARLNSHDLLLDANRQERLGPLESSASGTSSSSVAGLISIAGANLSPLVDPNFNTPTIFFHGTCDNAVPYRASRLAGCNNLGYYYGPGILQKNLEQMGSCCRLINFCGFGHDFAALEDQAGSIGFGLEKILENTIQFMLDVMCQRCSTDIQIANENVDITPSAACSRIDEYDLCGNIFPPKLTLVEVHPEVIGIENRVFIKSNFDFERTAAFRLYNASGALIHSEGITLPSGIEKQALLLPDLSKGMYFYEIVSGVRRWKAGKILVP